MTKPSLLILLFCLALSGYSQQVTTVSRKADENSQQGTTVSAGATGNLYQGTAPAAGATGNLQKGTTAAANEKMNRFARAEAAGKETLDSIYAVRTGTENAFINGTEYFPYHYRAKHKPLLNYGEERSAEIVVNGRKYDGMVLQYDTYTDEVLFSEMDNDFGKNMYYISLNRDMTETFSLFFRTDTLRFRYLTNEETGGAIPPGFYEMAYEGPTVYLIRHRSVVHQRNGIDEYYYSPVGYIKTPDGYSKITSGSKFAKLFGKDSEEMKEIVARQGIKLRKAGKREMIRLLRAFDNRTGVVQ